MNVCNRGKLAVGTFRRLLSSFGRRSQHLHLRRAPLQHGTARQPEAAAADLAGNLIRSWRRGYEASQGSMGARFYCREPSYVTQTISAPALPGFFAKRVNEAFTSRRVEPNRLLQRPRQMLATNAGFSSHCDRSSGSYRRLAPRSSSSSSRVKVGPKRRALAKAAGRNGAYSRKLPRKTILWVCTSAAVAVLLGTLEVVPYTGRYHLVMVPPKLERMLREYVLRQEKLRRPPLPSEDRRSVRVQTMFERILKSMEEELKLHGEGGGLVQQGSKRVSTRHLRGMEWEVVVVKSFVVNAFAAPGGKIVIYTGILDNSSDAELATIIGHEMGHVIGRHGAEIITTTVLCILPLAFLFHLLDVDVNLVSWATGYLFHRPLSRRKEMEADRIGLMLSSSAGYDPRVASKFYGKQRSSKWDDYMSTHPSGTTREQLLSKPEIMNEAMARYEASKEPNSIEKYLPRNESLNREDMMFHDSTDPRTS